MSNTAMITFLYEGRQRNANIKQVSSDFENMFRVAMDDGYENYFFTAIDRPYSWYEQNIGYTELAAAIGKAIEKTFL